MFLKSVIHLHLLPSVHADTLLMRLATTRPNLDKAHQPKCRHNSGACNVSNNVVMLNLPLRINGDDKTRNECGNGRGNRLYCGI
jgi:hypothetical protein